MKNFASLLGALTLLLVFGSEARAQYVDDWYWAVSYDMAAPLGDTKDFTGNFSFRGVGLEGRYFKSPKTSIGFFAGWNVFTEKVSGTVQDGNRTTTGTSARTINAVPLYVTGDYYFGDRGGARPYVGLGAGVIYNERRNDFGIFTSSSSKWQFALAPEAGVMFPVGASLMYVGLRYNYGFKAGDFESLQYLSINVGIGY